MTILSDSHDDNIQVVNIVGTSFYSFQSPCSFTYASCVQALLAMTPPLISHSI